LADRLRLIIVGFGVVGRAVGSLISKRQLAIERSVGVKFSVVAVVDGKGSVVDENGLDLASLVEIKLRTGSISQGGGEPNAVQVLRETPADVLVELTPGSADGEPGLSHLRTAITSGKDVVTANKMPLALDYKGLMSMADHHGQGIRYGACVGAGLPVFEFGDACAETERVIRIEGVLNATSNFILSEMESRGQDYTSAIESARKAGYAETDPRMDVEGTDSACKAVILANHFFGTDYALHDVKSEGGISGLSREVVETATSEGKRVRMLARVDPDPEVVLENLDPGDPLALRGASNAVRFTCELSGERTLMGHAAGGATTSTAVLRDLIATARVRAGETHS